MTTPRSTAVVPLVTVARHAAPSTWSRRQRAELARALEARGVGLTELSDARELTGRTRLSDATPEDRASAVQDLDRPEIQQALARVRTHRAALLDGLADCDPEVVGQARAILSLRCNSQLRLGELAALYAQTRILEITAEAPRTIRHVEPTPFWTDEELFAAAGGV